MAKITRKNQKIFASSAANNGQFGSAQTGTKIKTNDVETLQALVAYLQGWDSATISSKKLPTLEEFQALHYITNYQLAYLFQEGVSEWNTDTEYYQYSIVKKTGTFELYGSLTDNNQGNALTDDTNWILLGDVSKLNQIDAKKTRNFLINSSFDFHQEYGLNALTGSISKYGPDQWYIWGTQTQGYYVPTTSTLSSSKYEMIIGRNDGATNTNGSNIGQALETFDTRPLIGKNVVFSFKARKSATFSGAVTAIITYATTEVNVPSHTNITTQVIALTSTMTEYFITAIIPTNAKSVGVRFSWTHVGTASTDFWYLTECMLALGKSPTTYERAGNTIQDELAMCQRSFFKTYDLASAIGAADPNGSKMTVAGGAAAYSVCDYVSFKSTMRAIPVVTIYNPVSGATGEIRDGVTGSGVSAGTQNIGVNGCRVYNAGGTVDDRRYTYHLVAKARIS